MLDGKVAVVTGAGVNCRELGQRVAALSQILCGKCPQCAQGKFSECENILYLDYSLNHNGGCRHPSPHLSVSPVTSESAPPVPAA